MNFSPQFRRSMVAPVLAALILAAFASKSPAPPPPRTDIMTENFDGVAAPAIPNGWAKALVEGYASDWFTATSSRRHLTMLPPHSGTNLVCFNSYDCPAGNSCRLYYTTAFDVRGYTELQVTFWMLHEPYYSGSDGRVQVEASTDGGATWSAVEDVWRYSAELDGWAQHTISLAAYDSLPSLMIGFRGIADYGDDCHIDDVALQGRLHPCIPAVGTIGTPFNVFGIGFGAKRGRMTLGDGTALKTSGWTNMAISSAIGKAPAGGAGTYDIVVVSKDKQQHTISSAFTIVAPSATGILPAATPPKFDVTINGSFFGSQKGKVFLQGNGQNKSCAVRSWLVTNPDTEESEIHIVIPSLPAGSYDVVVVNQVGSSTLAGAFTVLLP